MLVASIRVDPDPGLHVLLVRLHPWLPAMEVREHPDAASGNAGAHWGHWPAILSTAIVLYLYRRERYYLLRNALFVSGTIGFLFFAFPGGAAEASRSRSGGHRH